MKLGQKLERLREMSLAEIGDRLRHKAAVLWDMSQSSVRGSRRSRAWWEAFDLKGIENPELRGHLQAGRLEPAAALLAEHLAARSTPRFYFDLSNREQFRQIYRERFPGRMEQIRAQGDAICAHVFQIFSYPAVHCGREIPWRRDLVHGKESGLQHYSRVPYLDFGKVGDSKIVWEPNRHQHFFTLGQAFVLSGEEKYAEELVRQWRQWQQENPYRRGINWASSLEAAFRAWSWVWALYLLLPSRAFAAALPEVMSALAGHAEHIAANLSTYFSPNTHLLGEGFALFVVGTLFPELRGADKWRETGCTILVEQMDRQVFPDGLHREQSSYYHRYALEFFLCAAILAERNGSPFPAPYRDRLEKMVDGLLFGSFPGGRDRLAGDADGGRVLAFSPFDPNNVRPTLATAAVYFSRGDLGSVAEQFAEDTLWLLGPDSPRALDRLPASAPISTSRTFADAGLVTMRSGWGEKAGALFFDAGPQGMLACGHGHADALSISCAFEGRAVLVDPGTFVYTASRGWRDFFRSTRAHNTLVVDGQDQAEPADFFKWRKVPRVVLERSISLPALDVAIGFHEGYTRLPQPVTHRRTVAFVRPHYWIICDEVMGTGTHDLEFFFHFAPGMQPRPANGGGVRTDNPDFVLLGLGPSIEWRMTEGRSGQDVQDIQGWYSSDYGSRVPAPVALARTQVTLPCRCWWLLCPGAPLELQLEEFGAAGIAIKRPGGEDTLLLGPPAEGCEIETDAELLLLRRTSAGNLERLVLLNGRYVKMHGQLVLQAQEQVHELQMIVGDGEIEITRRPEVAIRVPSRSSLRRTQPNAAEPVELMDLR